MSITCNKCNVGNLVDDGKRFKCDNESCGALLWHNSFGRDFTIEEANKLFGGEKLYLKGFHSRAKNTSYNSWCYYGDDNKLKLDFETPPPPVGTCQCGGAFTEFSKGYKCQNCGCIVWKNVAGKTLTEDEVKKLFAGEIVHVRGLTSRAGETFETDLIMDQDAKKAIFYTQPKQEDDELPI